MTDTNWPDPACTGVPMFPEYCGEHVLKEKTTGKEVFASWDADRPRSPAWDVVALYSQTTETVARYFDYVRCETVKLTPTQIAEMLAAERERCAIKMGQYKQKVVDDYGSYDPATGITEIASEAANTEIEFYETAAQIIRNLGAAP